MVNYNNTVIYKIFCKYSLIKDSYVGSTVNFRTRQTAHKCHVTNENSLHHNMLLYETIRKYDGWKNWTMEILEHFPCKTGLEKLEREQYWIEQIKPSINSNKAHITDGEKQDYSKNCSKSWRENNVSHVKNYQASWYDQHRIEILERSKTPEFKAHRKFLREQLKLKLK